MDQCFAERITKAGRNRALLIGIRDDLDGQKRSITAALRHMSHDPDSRSGSAAQERFSRVMRLKDKRRYLVEEREIVQKKLIRINREYRNMNKARDNKGIGFSDAFFAAASEILSEDQILEIESIAADILLSRQTES